MGNLSKIKREKMICFLEELKKQHNDEEITRKITEIENFLNEKKYGLVWEKHEEEIDKLLEENIPILEEVKEREIKVDDNGYNFLIEGDNLHSLKILEKTHKGKIDVIYIDPPYNTGNKDFVYNDTYVDKTDGYSHSKWLSFMEKRLQIARELLSDEGVIFISIDENEYAQLKLLCDEVFGENNYVENFIWIKNSTKNLSKTTSTNHEYVLCYSKNIEKIKLNELFRVKKEGYDEVINFVNELKNKGLDYKECEKELKKLYKDNPNWKGISNYNMIDEEYRIYTSDNSSAPKSTGVGNVYDIIHPVTNKPCKKPLTGWRYTFETMQEHIKNNLILFGKDETNVPRFKRLLSTVETEVQKSIINDFTDGKKELQKIFEQSPFDNPKPTTLIKILLKSSYKNSIILDFFAGSGTTGHAVASLNAEDGGNRKYILCTNNENNICTDVTYQRLKNIQSELPHNLKYLKAALVDDEDELYEASKVLTNLSNHKKMYIIEDEEEIDSVLDNVSDDVIYVSEDILFSSSQKRKMKEKNISVKEIPNEYYDVF